MPAEPAPPDTRDASPSTGTMAPVIPIESPASPAEKSCPPAATTSEDTDAPSATVAARPLSLNQKFRLWFERNIAIFRVDSIAMATAIALVPIGALFLMQRSTPFLRSMAKPGAVSSPSRSLTPTRIPQQNLSHKPGYTGSVSDVRYTSDSEGAVVTLDLDQETQFEVHRLSSPDRIYLDLQNTKLAPVLFGKNIQTPDRLLRALRVGEHEHQTTRITLATAQPCDYSVTRVPNSSQLRIELRKSQAPGSHESSAPAK